MTEDYDFEDLLRKAGEGDLKAWEKLVESIYKDVRRMASHFRDRTLSPTEVGHEAHLRMWLGGVTSREHLLARYGFLMKRILVDRARRRVAQRYGGEVIRVSISGGPDLEATVDSPHLDKCLAVNDAVKKLRCVCPLAADIIELCYWIGFTDKEISKIARLGSRGIRTRREMAQHEIGQIMSGTSTLVTGKSANAASRGEDVTPGAQLMCRLNVKTACECPIADLPSASYHIGWFLLQAEARPTPSM